MSTSTQSEFRSVMALPRVDDFYYILYDRIFMALNDLFLEQPFTFFLLALPRDTSPGQMEDIDRDNFPVKYAGLKRQREFLEYSFKRQSTNSLNKDWQTLEETRFNTSATRIGKVAEQQALGVSQLSQLPHGKLETYFINPNKDEAQEAEYNILNYWTRDIKSYCYLSLPLIQFGEIDGQIHIILHAHDLKKFLLEDEAPSINEKFVNKVLKTIIREYEGVFLDWEVEGENYDYKTKAFSRVTNPDFDTELYDRLEKNPILKELDLKEHYQLHKAYYQLRFALADQVPDRIEQQFRLNAILAIIIDSYAHNITAHSLAALEWLFRQRSLERQASDSLPNIDAQLVDEMHKMVEYLMNKGAFWTGLTREHSFGGKIVNLYRLLWEGFAQNLLLLGTIAFSEKIFRVNLKISIIENIESKEQFEVYFHKQVISSGVFVSIDLANLVENISNFSLTEKLALLKKGDEYENLSKHLLKKHVYLPGSVVGEQAFFTILENELRNVKHYEPRALAEMQKNGLTLHLSIEEERFDKQSNKAVKEYYKVGVWLEHPTSLDQDALTKRLEKIYGDVFEPVAHRPLLGGTSQDKVCAAFLINNDFTQVQQRNSLRDKRFYPWIKMGSSPEGGLVDGEMIEYCISARRIFTDDFPASKQYFEDNYQPHQGYFKKYFHIWQGADVFMINTTQNIFGDWENPPRFRFTSTYSLKDTKTIKRLLREAGITRIIHHPTQELATAYQIWLREWLLPLKTYHITFAVQDDIVGSLILSKDKIKFYNQAELEEEPIQPKTSGKGVQFINMVHSSEKQTGTREDNLVRYRRHGIFKQYFCNFREIEETVMSSALAAELLEVLATKVIVFDNRVASRLESLDKEVLKNQLKCEAYREEVTIWEKQKKRGFEKFQIMVLHLSFIETFFDTNGKKLYSEADIKKFIDQELLSNLQLKDKQNFLLVVTTGRGRTQWWEKLRADKSSNYTEFVTFRPVESILSAIEDAFSIQDDLELKYRLVKVLLGS